MYNRYCEVIVNGLSIGTHTELLGTQMQEPMNIEISIEHDITRNPNKAEIRIYNLSPENQLIVEAEGSNIEVYGGYKNLEDEYFGLLFIGKTRRASTVSQDADTITTIWAGDADDAFKYSKLRQTFPAGGNDPATISEALAAEFEARGVLIGDIRIEGPPDERATTIDRPVRLELDDLCRRYNCHWTIHNNEFYLWPKEEPIETQPVLQLTSETGLIGVPEPTENGVRIKTLMIHEIRPGFLIELKTTKPLGKDRDIDGFYRVEHLNFTGSTMGSRWIADINARRFEGVVIPSRNVFAGEGGQ